MKSDSCVIPKITVNERGQGKYEKIMQICDSNSIDILIEKPGKRFTQCVAMQ